MRSEDLDRIRHTILDNIALARRFLADMNFESFATDDRTLYAVTRCLEIISEASRRLPAAVKARHPSVPWTNIAGAGNIYRHEYENVLPSILWNTVRNHLGPLEAAMNAEEGHDFSNSDQPG